MSDESSEEFSEEFMLARSELDALNEELVRLLERAATLPASIVLCATTFIVLWSRFGIRARDALPAISADVQANLKQLGFVGRRYLQLDDLVGQPLTEGTERARLISPDLERTLDRFTNAQGVMLFAGRVAAAIAKSFDIEVGSAMAVIGECAVQMADRSGGDLESRSVQSEAAQLTSDEGFEQGQRDADAVYEDSIELLERADTLPACIMLCGYAIWLLRKRFEVPVSRSVPIISRSVRALALDNAFVGNKNLPLSYLDVEQFDEGLTNKEEGLVDLEWMLNRITGVHGIVACTARMAALIAIRHDLTEDSLMAVVGELAVRLERGSQEPKGAAELVTMSAYTELFSDTFDACFGLANATKDNGAEGFLAYRDASPYLRTPTGFLFGKYVAHADLEGAYGPISGVVTAAFNSVGLCKRTEVTFRGNERDLVQVRRSICDALVKDFGNPTPATEKVSEWAVPYRDANLRYTVELTPEYTGAQLTTICKIEPFW